jgi:hypothetical protein
MAIENYTQQSDAVLKEPEYLFPLMRGEFKEALFPLGIARATTILAFKRVELLGIVNRGGYFIQNVEKVGHMDANFRDFLNARDDISHAFEYYSAFLKILKAAGFAEADIGNAMSSVASVFFPNAADPATKEKKNKLQTDINRALNEVFHGKSAG